MYEELNPSKLFLVEALSHVDLNYAKTILTQAGYVVREFPSGFNSPKNPELDGANWQDIYNKNV